MSFFAVGSLRGCRACVYMWRTWLGSGVKELFPVTCLSRSNSVRIRRRRLPKRPIPRVFSLKSEGETDGRKVKFEPAIQRYRSNEKNNRKVIISTTDYQRCAPIARTLEKTTRRKLKSKMRQTPSQMGWLRHVLTLLSAILFVSTHKHDIESCGHFSAPE